MTSNRPSRRPAGAALALASVLVALTATTPARAAGDAPTAAPPTTPAPTSSPTLPPPWDGDTTPPTAPGAPEVVRVDGTSVDLRWPGSVDEWEVTYQVRDAVTGQWLATTYAPAAHLEGLQPFTDYRVYVTAQDMAGNAAPRSPEVTFTTGAATPAGCTVQYRTDRRPGGFVGRVTVRNDTTAPVHHWRLWWAFTNGEQATRVWGAVPVQLEQGVFVESLPHAGPVEPGESVTVRFRATGVPQRPAGILFDGEVCAFA